MVLVIRYCFCFFFGFRALDRLMLATSQLSSAHIVSYRIVSFVYLLFRCQLAHHYSSQPGRLGPSSSGLRPILAIAAIAAAAAAAAAVAAVLVHVSRGPRFPARNVQR